MIAAGMSKCRAASSARLESACPERKSERVTDTQRESERERQTERERERETERDGESEKGSQRFMHTERENE